MDCEQLWHVDLLRTTVQLKVQEAMTCIIHIAQLAYQYRDVSH